MNGTEERDNNSNVSKLDGLKDAPEISGCLVVDHNGIVEGIDGRDRRVQVPCEVHGGKRRYK